MRILRSAFAVSPWLTSAVLASAAFAFIMGIASMFDTRIITGASALYKPIKFAISFTVYGISLIWFLGLVKKHPRLAKTTAFLMSLAITIELVIIALQALRGTTSHYNLSTSFDEQLFIFMGIFILVAWLMNLAAMLLLLIEHIPDPVFATGLRLSLAIAAISMAMAGVMLQHSAHTIGLADGGPGLPFLGWSTVGGDLRIFHFFGLHAVQLIPLVAYAINQQQRRLSVSRRIGLVWVAGLGYLGWVLLLFWQALRGQSIVAPDLITLGAFAGLLLMTLGVGYLVCRRLVTNVSGR